ncbi:hypothetical protein, partial [Apibacter sp. B3924]
LYVSDLGNLEDLSSVSLVTVARGKNLINTHECPRCKADITVDLLKQVYSGVKDTKILEELAEALNKYKDKFNLDTCARKAHFFAQSREESGLDLKGALEGESLNYAAEDLPKHFINFSSTGKLEGPPNELAYQYGRTAQHPANQRKIAEIAY